MTRRNATIDELVEILNHPIELWKTIAEESSIEMANLMIALPVSQSDPPSVAVFPAEEGAKVPPHVDFFHKGTMLVIPLVQEEATGGFSLLSL